MQNIKKVTRNNNKNLKIILKKLTPKFIKKRVI